MQVTPGTTPTRLRTAYVSDLTPADCDLTTGLTRTGGAATDGTAAVNAFLAQATADTPVVLILDGGVLTTGIHAPAGGHWSIVGQGWDTGFFIKAGSNSFGIANSPYTAYNTINVFPASASGGPVTMKNFRLNCNRGTGTNGNCNSGDPRYATLTGPIWVMGMSLGGIKGLLMEDVWVYDPPTFGVMIGNCADITIRGCRFESPSMGVNTDGVHINGGCSNVLIEGCRFVGCGDDSVALNAAEGRGGGISRAIIRGCLFERCLSLVRLLTEPGSNIDTVLVSDCLGDFTAGNGGGIIDNMLGSGQVDRFTMVNCELAGAFLGNFANCTRVEFANVRWTPNGAINTAGPNATYGIGSTANVPLNILGTVGTLVLNGFSIATATGGATSTALLAITGPLNKLVVTGLDLGPVSALYTMSGGGTLSIVGPGVLSTGLALPASVMGKWSPYLDSGSGVASYKNAAGTVTAL